MRDAIGHERLAPIMRTSAAMLEDTYGKHTADSYRKMLAAAAEKEWGNGLIDAPSGGV